MSPSTLYGVNVTRQMHAKSTNSAPKKPNGGFSVNGAIVGRLGVLTLGVWKGIMKACWRGNSVKAKKITVKKVGGNILSFFLC